jgi:DNA replication and repair protein RecF
VRLLGIGLRGFRNLADGDLELPSGGLALVGANAQGKSNFLEAIYYMEAFRSFRGARDEELIRFGGDLFRLEGRLDADPGTLSVAFRRSPRTKKGVVGGTEVLRLADGVGILGAVVFSPDDLRLVTDGPHERRHFLNVLLSLGDPKYLDALQRFRQVLSQRNSALRDGASPAAVGAWDEGLIRWGGRVATGRARWIRRCREPFRDLYQGVAGAEGVRMEYAPGIPEITDESGDDEMEEAYRRALTENREREARRGITVVGPHRDEVRIFLETGEGERDLRAFGSGGQRRTAALALRLLEAEEVRTRRGTEPLLLLDDVFAELDEGRSARVMELLDRIAVGQVIVTAPKESELRFRRDLLPRWTIRNGEISS